ncbi:isopentenyl-diphosphate Delta-isomerase [Halomonas sp. BM-2019]|uniref:isopentenyl-diphosphate Delta-isomerase n=1 Tax=Halomonas sp. BM-2019 TaxID=2811227 RepID=UPI001B3C2748|nr:MAG: isopentenyl-diphosphate Delta-isomerase [Halomonas sp. BM-2019]
MAEVNDDRVVSFDDEPLVLVDSEDRELGFCTKADAHRGEGRLHRAFSLVVFNSAGALLLQRRAAHKPLWPGYWSNTVCSHPRRGEAMDAAIQRRLREEVGLQAEMSFLFKFQYRARFGDKGSEHELCWVYAGRSDATPRANPQEVDAIRYLSPGDVDEALRTTPEAFTPWFHLEWPRIRRDHSRLLGRGT